jgi:hypothetical protein
MENKKSQKNTESNERIKEIVIARIDAQVPSNLKLAIGSYGGMSKEEMIEHVKREDDIGKQIIKRHLLFLKSLASGDFTRALASIE